MMGRNTHKNVNKIKVVERKLVTGKSKQTKLPIMGKNVTGKNARKIKVVDRKLVKLPLFFLSTKANHFTCKM